MNRQNTLTLLTQKINIPLLFIADISELTGMSDANFRMHVKSKNLLIPLTPKPARGQGVKALYPPADAIEVFALSEIVKQKIPTKLTAKDKYLGNPVSYMIGCAIINQLIYMTKPNEIIRSTDPKIKSRNDAAKARRYSIIYNSSEKEGIAFANSNNGLLPEDYEEDNPFFCWHVVDTFEMALAIVEFFETKQHVLWR